jgi:hypothetical protein
MEPQTKNVVPSGNVLTDYVPIKLTVVEGTDGTSKVRVRGEFARADQATQNGRVYPRSLWEREIGRMSKDMDNRKVFGELDHPTDGRTLLSRVSHVLTNLTVEEDGTITGEAEVLDTARGQDLKALLKSGCSVGVSSRGLGSTATTKEGKELVQDDYRLMTFDFVAEPAMQTAYPRTFFEAKEGQDPVDAEAVALGVAEQLSAALEKQENQLRNEFASKLPVLIEALKGKVREQVRAELLADPAVAGAQAALEQVKVLLRPFVLSEDAEAELSVRDSEIAKAKKTVMEQALRIRELEDDAKKLESLARTAGYKYFMERTLSGDENEAIIRAAVGDVESYSTLAQLQAKLSDVQTRLDEQDALEAKAEEERLEAVRQEKLRSDELAAEVRAQLEAVKAKTALIIEAKDLELVAAQAQVEQARKTAARELSESREAQIQLQNAKFEEIQLTVNKLQGALEASLEAQHVQELTVYAERKISKHPRADEIRLALSEALDDTSDRQDVDRLIEGFPAGPVSVDTDDVRTRVRRMTRGGTQPSATTEETPKKPIVENSNYQDTGLDIRTMRKLAGLTG